MGCFPESVPQPQGWPSELAGQEKKLWLRVSSPLLLFSRSVVSDSLRPDGLQHARLSCPSPSLEFAQTHVHRVGEAIQPSHPLSTLLHLPSIFPSIRVFSNESAFCIRWPNYWSFSISPSNEHSGLISLGLTALISLQSKGHSRVFSNTTVQKCQFFSTQLSL